MRTIPVENPKRIQTAFKQFPPNTAPCTSANQWGLINYDKSSSYVNNVLATSTLIDNAKEVSC
jgi:hypothetical protein